MGLILIIIGFVVGYGVGTAALITGIVLLIIGIIILVVKGVIKSKKQQKSINS